MLHRLLVAAILCSLIALPASVGASESLSLDIVVNGSASGNTYSAYPDESFFPDDPNPGNLQFKTGVISSADQTFMAVATGPQSGWRSELTPFSSSQSLLNALDQPWTITLDQGLPTERHFTMNLNLGSLPSIDLTPPAPLFDDTQYIFGLFYQNPVSDVVFSDPIDANGNALPGWSSGGSIALQSTSYFSTPEPATGGLMGICSILLIRRRVRRI